MSGAVPVIAHRRLSALPRYLPAEDVERVIASCDRASALGRRDRAILLLLARLGLRAGDIVQLRLGDIDWKAAWIQVSGKSRRETRLPLTHEVGDALSTYVVSGRPPTDDDGVFSRVPLALCGLGDRGSRFRASGYRPPESGRRAPPAALRRHVDAVARGVVAGRRGGVAPPVDHDDGDLCQGRCHCARSDRAAVAGGGVMLTAAVTSYVAVRRATGFTFRSEARLLERFAAFSQARGTSLIRTSVAVDWASLARSIPQRARRLGHVIRLAVPPR